jgi:hypothetical protein
MTDCLICIEEFDVKKRKKISCPYCQQSACMQCYMITFLNSLDEASCMFPNCSSKDNDNNFKTWNIQFLTDNFPKSYIWGPGTNVKKKILLTRDGKPKKAKSPKRSYRQHREEMLVDQQMSLMPSTQPVVEKEMKIKRLNKERKLVNRKLKSKSYDLVFKNRKKEISKELQTLRNPLNIKREKKVKIVNRGNCPQDTCNGFITNGWKCGICETCICKDCRETILPDQVMDFEEYTTTNNCYIMISKRKIDLLISNKIHSCDPNILKTVQELSKSSYKSCPQCRAFIEKSAGCNQMFCTNCNIFFDWASGKEIKKTRFVHNPHYQDWVEHGQKQGRQTAPIVGDCEVSFQNINRLEISKEQKKLFNDVIRFINEIREQNHSMNPTVNLEESLLTIRKRFLSGEYGTEGKQKLGIETQRAYKRESKANEILQIKEMYSETSSQIIARLLLDIKDKDKPKPHNKS